MHIRDRHINRVVLVALTSMAALALIVWSHLPAKDPAAYFNFADQRFSWGIPNFWDVVSNLAFIYVGLWGMMSCYTNAWIRSKKAIWWGLFWVNFSVFLTGWGSSLFHLNPNPLSLFLDRAPMAMGFMALFSVIMVDRTQKTFWGSWLLPLMALGVWAAWQGSYGAHDIRYFIIVQFGSLLLALLFTIIRKPIFTNNILVYSAFVFYVLAKLFELADHPVFVALDYSGHTLKHIMAALAILAFNLSVRGPIHRAH
jgi:hypothetical protein